MLIILLENAFEESIWCQKIYTGLKEELKRRRLSYKKEQTLDSILTNDTVFIIGSGYVWINHSILFCNELGITPIVLCNQISSLPSGIFHCVSTDTTLSMQQLIMSANTTDTSKIALYGVNNTSISDMSRMKSFMEITKNSGGVFTNNGSLECCFNNFITHIKAFETVICVNNYAAISLVRKLSDKYTDELDRLKIISCSSSKLSSVFSEHIMFVDMNFEKYGKAAMAIYDLSLKNQYVSSITVMISCSFDSSASLKTNQKEADIAPIDNFYKDKEIQRFVKMERLLYICDDTDIKILEMLLSGKNYESIAECCYLSKESVKYRIKKYINTCEVTSKAELMILVGDYYPFN